MKLYIKQKVFSWGDQFAVRDAFGNEKYYVEGEIFSFGKKLHVYDRSQREVALIRQELWTWMPTYHVHAGGREVAQIRKEFSFLFPKYSIDGLGWEINGDFWNHEYAVTCGNRTIVTIEKEWMTWGDSYELNIADSADELIALAVVLTIDCVIDNSSKSN